MSLPTNFFIGRGGGASFPPAPDFTAVNSQELLWANYLDTHLMNIATGTWSSNSPLAAIPYGTGTNFPAEQADYIWSQEDPTVQRYVIANSSTLRVIGNTQATFSVLSSINNGGTIRGCMMLRNGIFIAGCNSNNELRTYVLTPSGNLQLKSTLYNSRWSNVEGFANPDDGAKNGGSTLVHVFSNNYLDAITVAGDGTITTHHTFTDSTNIGAISAASGLGCFIARDNNDVYRLEYIPSSGYGVTHAGAAGSDTSTGITLSSFGFIFTGYYNREFQRVNSNLVTQGTNTTSSEIPYYPVSIIWIKDNNTYGSVFIAGFDQGGSLEQTLTRMTVPAGNGFGTFEVSNHIATGWTGGGSIVGQRPKYAEQDYAIVNAGVGTY